jgi:hypothetical protein
MKLDYLSLHLGQHGLRGLTDEYLLGKQTSQLRLLSPKGIHHTDTRFGHQIVSLLHYPDMSKRRRISAENLPGRHCVIVFH